MIASLPLPPSVNNMYTNVPGRGRALTEEAKSYKHEVMGRLMMLAWRKRDPGPPYVLTIWLLYADRRRRDASNMSKAIEDAIATYLGYNDELNLTVTAHKGIDRAAPRAVIELRHKTESIPPPPDIDLQRMSAQAAKGGTF